MRKATSNFTRRFCKKYEFNLFRSTIGEMYGEKAAKLFSLLTSSGLIGAEGHIKFELLDTNINISDKSAVGNLIQEWLGAWMTNHEIFNKTNENTQAFPDFFLSESKTSDLLEVKSFDFLQTPNFDVAQFDAYVRSLRTQAFRLDADYLIFGYTLISGTLVINKVWLKKIWEITCESGQFALRTNVKQGKIHNIRPYNFKDNSRGFAPFNNRKAFVSAIKDTMSKYIPDDSLANEWFKAVEESYLQLTGKPL